MIHRRMRIRAMSVLVVWILVCACFVGMFGLFNEFAFEAEGITVPVDYPSIQSAIENASEGETIYVWAGTYFENIVVNKTLTIVGNGTANTTIDGGGVGDVVKITADWVNITGFTITNSGSGDGDAGIELDCVKNCNITNNDISNNNYGIYSPRCGILNIPDYLYLDYIPGNHYDEHDPQINDFGEVAWQRNDGTGYAKIFVWDGSSTELRSVSQDGNDPRISNTGEVAYWGFETPYDRVYIDSFAISSATDDYYFPEINDNGNAVYVGPAVVGIPVPLDYEIFLHPPYQITDNTVWDTSPQINNNEEVVWISYDSNDYEILFWNQITITNLTDNAYDDATPQINDNNEVVWSGADGSDYEILFWNGTSTTNLTDNVYNDQNPQISNNGEVVWEGWDGNDWEIFFWNGTSVLNLTDNAYNDKNTQINDNGEVVWQGQDGDWEIFLWDGTRTAQITNNVGNDQEPQINENGEVVWEGWNGTEWNIYFYYGPESKDNTISGNSIINNQKGIILFPGSSGNTITGNDIGLNSNSGIFIDYTSDNIISENDIFSNTQYGIYLSSSSDNTILNNTITSNGDGISVHNFSINNDIMNNTIDSNTLHGILLVTSNNNNISENDICFNDLDGINITDLSHNNTISNNNISSNTNYGIYITSSDNNVLYHNDIIGNGIQAFDDSANYWNLPYPGGGNYWDDYIGYDFYSGVNQDILGSDAIGDQVYPLSGGTGATDYYPLMRTTKAPEGGIIISSHDYGEHVSDTIVIEAVTTFTDVLVVNFYINGTLKFSDDTSPYQYIFDTTIIPEDEGFEVKAEAVLQYSSPANVSIILIANNYVQTGDYITVSTVEPEYRPDEEVSVLVTMTSPPSFDALDLIVKYEDPSGNPLYSSEENLPYDTEYLVILPLPSDAELGPYTITVDAYGYVDGSLIWSATNGTTFTISGKSLSEQLEELAGLNATLDDLASQLTGVNDSLMSTISGLESNILTDLAGVNASLAFDIQKLLTDITGEISGLNASLADQLANLNVTANTTDLQTWLELVLGQIDANLTDTRNTLQNQLDELNTTTQNFYNDIVSDLMEVFDSLSQLEDNLSIQHSATRSAISTLSDTVENEHILTRSDILNSINSSIAQIQGLNGTVTAHDDDIQNVLDQLMTLMADEGNMTRDQLVQNLSEVLSQMQYLDSEIVTHSDEVNENLTILSDLINNLETFDISELSQKLADLEGNLSAHDTVLASDIAIVQDSVDDFQTEVEGRLEDINNTLAEMDKLQALLDDLVELDQNLDQAQQSIDEIPKEKKEDEGFGITEGLLIVMILLLLVNLLLMIMGKGKTNEGGQKALPDEEGMEEEMPIDEDEGEEDIEDEEDWEDSKEEPEEEL